MIGHYVEDDELDALSFAGMIGIDSNLSITSSRSLNDIETWLGWGDVDFILIDIYRPDSVSMQADVAKIRAHSKAPIIFITGDEAEHYREQAVLAGAQAVIEKTDLSLDSLHAVLKNVVAMRPDVELADDAEHALIEGLPKDAAAGISAIKLTTASDYLVQVLASVADVDMEEGTLRSTVRMVSNSIPSLLAYAYANEQEQSSEQVSEPLPKAIRAIQKSALAMATKRKVQLVFQFGSGTFEGLKTKERVPLGIRHLLHAAIVDAPAGSKIAFSGTPSENGLRLTVSSSQPLKFATDAIFTRQVPQVADTLNSTVSMTLAAMLLNLEPDDVTVVERGSFHTVIVDYDERKMLQTN